MADTTKANVLLIAPELASVISNVAQMDFIEVNTVSNTQIYSVTINATTVSFTSDASATAAEIIIGIKAAIEANSVTNALVTVTNNLDGTCYLTAKTAGTAYTLLVSAKLTSTNKVENYDGDELFDLILDDVSDEITTLDIVEAYQEKAQRFLCAHLIYLQTVADASGLTATSESIGKASVSYSDKYIDEDELKKTRWGVEFLRIWKKYRYLKILA